MSKKEKKVKVKKESKFFGGYTRVLLLMVAGIISLSLIACGIMILNEYTQELTSQASVKAQLYSTEASSFLHDNVASCMNSAELLASRLSGHSYENEADFLGTLRTARMDDKYSYLLILRYFNGENEYIETGSPFNTQNENPAVLAAAKNGETKCTGFAVDWVNAYNVVSFVAAVKDCNYATSVALFYPPDVIREYNEEDIPQEALDASLMTVMCSSEGEVLSILSKNGIDVAPHNNVYELLEPLINDKSIIDDMKNASLKNTSQTFKAEIGGASHIISISSVGESNGSFNVIGVYKCLDVYREGYDTISTILAVLIIFSVVMVIIVIYSIINARITNKRILTMNDNDQDLNVYSEIKFVRVAEDILSRNKATKFAVVLISMKHYNYLLEKNGKDGMLQILIYLKHIFEGTMQVDETFGYAGEGRFLLFIHYKDRDALVSRLKILASLARNYGGNTNKGYKLELVSGVYETDNNITNSVAKMIDLAEEAEDAPDATIEANMFHFYNEKIQESHKIREYIEVNQGKALADRNFVVFYQPKMNIRQHRPESSEALVRWYNPETDDYMVPGIFMPLFERNGFISQVDRYVYEEVCRYIEESTRLGQRVIPVSVNVSGYTAMEKDFTSYYIARKRAHQIADGFITIEFTESVAVENYERLREIIAELHKNGFKCSIDDFGTGYSSFKLLKEISMDEVKLDRFFLDNTISSERDRNVLKSIIELSKQLNMKVVQEGVETIEQYQMLKDLGCDIIQGYYFSKPLHMSDYIDFISRDHKEIVFL